MADGTHIQWTDATWNVVTGCRRVSAGCDHCYIERTPPFRMTHRKFDKPGVGGTTGVLLHPERLTIPLKWRKPRRIFVNSLSDLFHDEVPDTLIAEVFAVMAAATWHTYQVLTKRPARMRSLLNSKTFARQVNDAYCCLPSDIPTIRGYPWPLPSVWLGVSVEDQRWADIRIPALLETPAAVRFLSCEPLLGPIDLTPWMPATPDRAAALNLIAAALDVSPELLVEPRPGNHDTTAGRFVGSVSWVITGGESGPGYRPADPAWFREIRDQCNVAGVAFLHKQNGGPRPTSNGRTLDGRTWDQYPTVEGAR